MISVETVYYKPKKLSQEKEIAKLKQIVESLANNLILVCAYSSMTSKAAIINQLRREYK